MFCWLSVNATAQGVRITATKDKLLFAFDQSDPQRDIIEVSPDQGLEKTGVRIVPIMAHNRTLSIPRFDGARDRIYSGFSVMGKIRFVEEWDHVAKNRDGYPKTSSKKGLQVQMVDDALALGVKQAGLNFDLGSSIALTPGPDDFRRVMDGREFWFRRPVIEWLDRSVKSLSEAGAAVTLILLNYEGHDAALQKVLLHPNYDRGCPQHLSAFNTSTPEGLAWFKAWMEFMAERYSAAGYPHGRVVNYIVGNEVNSHWEWANMGHVTMEQFALDYLRTVRVCHAAVRKFSEGARVFISLEHHWNIRSAGGDKSQAFPGHPFVAYMNQLSKAGGDFDWDIAFHPYPEDLFECRTWLDKTATYTEDTKRITFKNIEMLPRFLQRKEMRFKGSPRRVILSEQGFHSKPTAEGELFQAAAYCYAWRKVVNLDGVDAFILHRHVDNAQEFGLNLGLWRHKEGTVAEPLSKKPIYEVFRAADTRDWEKSFRFALPVIGIRSWKEIENARR